MHQLPFETSSQSWFSVLLTVAGILTGGGAVKLYNIYLNRRKPQAEVHETEARGEKLRAEASSEISQSMARVTVRLEQMQIRVDEIVKDRDEWKFKAEQRKTERDLAISQLSRATGLLQAHGIKYSEGDEQK